MAECVFLIVYTQNVTFIGTVPINVQGSLTATQDACKLLGALDLSLFLLKQSLSSGMVNSVLKCNKNNYA